MEVIDAINSEFDSRCGAKCSEDFFKARLDGWKFRGLKHRKVEIFRETVVSKVAASKCSAALEGEVFADRMRGECCKKPGQAIVPLQDGFRNPSAALLAEEAIREEREIALRNHLRVRDGAKLLGRNVDTDSPARLIWPFRRQAIVERFVSRCEARLERANAFRCFETACFEQEAEPADHGTDVEPKGIVDQALDVQILAAQKDRACDFGDSADVLRVAQAVDNSALGIAHGY